MAEVEEYADSLRRLAGLVNEASDVARDVCGWPLEQLILSYSSMYDRFCPFKVGDRVSLNKAPPCEGGWSGSRHFLIPGALGTVKSRGYSDGLFTFYVMFDDESWRDGEGCVHATPEERRHVYGFSENWLWPAAK